MKQSIIYQVRQRIARSEGAGDLNKGWLPQKRTFVHPFQDPIADLGVLELLEGADVGEVLLLNSLEYLKVIDGCR